MQHFSHLLCFWCSWVKKQEVKWGTSYNLKHQAVICCGINSSVSYKRHWNKNAPIYIIWTSCGFDECLNVWNLLIAKVCPIFQCYWTQSTILFLNRKSASKSVLMDYLNREHIVIDNFDPLCQVRSITCTDCTIPLGRGQPGPLYTNLRLKSSLAACFWVLIH